MKCYQISGKLLPIEDGQCPQTEHHLVVVYTAQDIAAKQVPAWITDTPMQKDQISTACKAEVFPQYITGAYCVPRHGNQHKRVTFSYCVREDSIFFLDDTGTVMQILEQIARHRTLRNACVGYLIFIFWEELIFNDSRYLQAVFDKVGFLEEQILAGTLENVNQTLSPTRRELLTLFRFYDQLGDMAQVFEVNENDFFQTDIIALFRLFGQRADRLLQQVSMLRDYCIQIFEVYQAEIDVRQNRIMKVLTVVTTIFSPLAFIVGWYGMNFQNMPELSWAYGYPAIIAFSVATVLVCLWIFKKKKYF